jgi:hypothetical protein
MTTARKPDHTLDPWMSVGAAARELGETRLATLTRIVKGELIGQHVGGLTFVRRDTVDALLASRDAVGVSQ